MSEASQIITGVAQIALVLADIVPLLFNSSSSSNDGSPPVLTPVLQTGDVEWSYSNTSSGVYLYATNMNPYAGTITLQFSATKELSLQQQSVYLYYDNPTNVTPILQDFNEGLVTMVSSTPFTPSGTPNSVLVTNVALGTSVTVSTLLSVTAEVQVFEAGDPPQKTATLTFNLDSQDGFTGQFIAVVWNNNQSVTLAGDLISTGPTSQFFELAPFLDLGVLTNVVDQLQITLFSTTSSLVPQSTTGSKKPHTRARRKGAQ